MGTITLNDVVGCVMAVIFGIIMTVVADSLGLPYLGIPGFFLAIIGVVLYLYKFFKKDKPTSIGDKPNSEADGWLMQEIYQDIPLSKRFFEDAKPKLTEYGKFFKWVADHNSNETDKTISFRFNPIDPRDMRYIEMLKASGLKFIQFLNVAVGGMFGGSDTYVLFEKNEVDSSWMKYKLLGL